MKDIKDMKERYTRYKRHKRHKRYSRGLGDLAPAPPRGTLLYFKSTCRSTLNVTSDNTGTIHFTVKVLLKYS